MSLQEILQKIVAKGEPVLLTDKEQDWEASDLLGNLSERALKTQAHLQQGLYIAEINNGGYLGRVMYKVKQRA